MEAEQSVLGSMIIEKEAIFAAAELLRDQDFYRTAHQKIFEAIIALSEKNEPVDLVTLSDELERRRFLEEVGGMAYLVSLANAVPTAANVRYYAQIVQEKSILRSLINAATNIVTRCYESPDDVEEILDQAEQHIFEIGSQGKQQGFIALKDVLMQAFDRIERLYDEKKGVTGISTGFTDLDQISSGLQESDLIIVAARPSMGKTTLALNMAQHIAVNIKKVAFSAWKCQGTACPAPVVRAGANNAQKMRRGTISPEEYLLLPVQSAL